MQPAELSAVGPRVGVIDIGSNSVRLVVFDGLSRSPVALFNEKVFAALGKTVSSTGRLNPEGVAQAHATLTRFSRLLKAMHVPACHVVATAAVRDAADGKAFLQEVKARAELDVTIISGEEEGRLSAEGVLSGIPDADGAMGDMGGGSVELVRLDKGRVGARVSLPLGPFRLMTIGGGRAGQTAAIDSSLASQPWLPEIAGASLYAVGGIWRAFATVHMEQVKHPLHIIQHYAIDAAEAIEFAQLLSRQSRASLEGAGISKRRIDALPHAALFMERLLRRAGPRRLVFSANGLREGIIYDLLTSEMRAEDPLLSACDSYARRMGRFGESHVLVDWVAPMTPLSRGLRRLTIATCLLSDTGWAEHPDYRGEQTYMRALRMPYGGIDHAGRAFIALALYLRYGGRADDPVTGAARALLDESTLAQSVVLGLTLRLACTLCGGAFSLLERTTLSRGPDRLTLTIAPDAADLRVDSVERRLDALAKTVGLVGEVKIG